MEMVLTEVYRKNLAAYLNPRIRRSVNEGGTSSSKTWSILQLLILIARYSKRPLIISVVSESLPHLKLGAIRDFKKILGTSYSEKAYNRTEQTYTFESGSIIEFWSAEDTGKASGPRRDILYLNEANNIPWEVARAADIRTDMFTFADWNPTSEFWIHEYDLDGGKRAKGWRYYDNTEYIHSTYLDAINVLSQSTIDNIESNKDIDPNWWTVFGLGLLGNKPEGLVYPFFEQVEKLPVNGNEFYTLDFGFSGDPASFLRHKLFPKEIYSQQLIYDTNLTNQDLADLFDTMGVNKLGKGSDVIWADSAEPKSIEEIYRRGYNIKGAPKGPGSVNYGHGLVRALKQFWTTDSLDGIKEQRNFRYLKDKDGKYTDKTTHRWSHAMDSRRYGVMGEYEPPEPEEAVIVYDTMQEMGVNMDL